MIVSSAFGRTWSVAPDTAPPRPRVVPVATPRAGVTSVGDVARTIEPDPVVPFERSDAAAVAHPLEPTPVPLRNSPDAGVSAPIPSFVCNAITAPRRAA